MVDYVDQIFSESDDSEINQYKEIFRNFITESDRGCVLAVTALLDDALESLLRARFETNSRVVKKAVDPLFGAMGPLSSFYSRTKLAYALGLINHNVHDALDNLRAIRNKFAHQSGVVELTDPQVTGILDKMTSQNKRFAIALGEVLKDEIEEIESSIKNPSTSSNIPAGLTPRRIHFLVCTGEIYGNIESKTRSLNQSSV